MDINFAQALQRNVDSLRQLRAEHPSSVVLPVMTLDELQESLTKLIEAGDVLRANRVFWNDQLVSFEAWRYTVLWRATEQIESALALKQNSSLIGCATLSRSAFELAISSLVVSARLCKVLKQINSDSLTKTICFSNTFPDDIERALYGTRIAKAERVGRPSQKSVITYLDQIEKLSGEDLKSNYDLLCDLTHPSWFGNRAYWRTSEHGTLSRVSSKYDPEWEVEATLLIDTVLAWTSQAIENALRQSHDAIQRTRNLIKSI